jgi:hypothetical protein
MLNELLNIEPVNYKNDAVRFEHALTKTIDLLQHLDETLSGLNQVLKLDLPADSAVLDVFGNKMNNNMLAGNQQGGHELRNNVLGKTGSDEDSKPVSGTTQGMIQLAENTIKVTESFGKLGGELKNVKTGLGLMSSINNGFGGIGELMSMGSKRFSMTVGVAAAGAIMDGIAGVVATEAAFGPVGWATAAATLVVNGIVSVNEQDKAIKKRNAEEERNTEHSMQSFVMSEADASGYLSQMRHLIHEKPKPWKLPFDPVSDNVKKFGPGAYDLPYQGPKQAFTNFEVKNLPPGVYDAKEDEMPVKKSYLEKTSDVQNRLNYAGWKSGIGAINQQVVKEIADARKSDRLNHTNSLMEVDGAIEESFGNMVTKANENGAYSLTGPDYANSGGGSYGSGSSPGGKVININLNKAMIENFTVKANSVNEGLGDFKHKVEEVLLEILNSANAIQ